MPSVLDLPARVGPRNECFAEDAPRPPYEPLFAGVEELGPARWGELDARADRLCIEEGVTFTLRPGEERILPVDWLPRLIPADHWDRIERGLAQRVVALNEFLKEVYAGKKTPVPDEIVRSSRYFYPACVGFAPPKGVYLHIYGPDLVHMGEGRYIILEDNARIPSGASYALKYRALTERLFPELFSRYRVRSISDYPRRLREVLEYVAPREDPRIVLLSEGTYNAAFYDHKILAERAGIPLVFPSDLFADADGLWMETATGVERVDCVYRRIQDLDDFVPGLSAAYLRGQVNLCAAWGTGVSDDKGTFPYTPEIVRRYTGEDPILEIAPTYSLLDEKVRKHVAANLERMVVKPREGYGGFDILIGPESTRAERERFRDIIEREGLHFIAQDCLDFSTHCLARAEDGALRLIEAYVDLRTYVLLGEEPYVLPGGISRVAPPGSRVVNSSSGGLIKETWVLEGDL